MLVGIGAIEKHKNNTIPIIGKTAPNDSRNFSKKFVICNFKRVTRLSDWICLNLGSRVT